MEGPVFGGAYLWREICVSELIGLALYLEVNLPFLLCFTLNLRAIFQVQAPGRIIFGGGDLTEGFSRYWFGGLIFGGAYTWRGLFSEFYGNQLTHVDGFCSLKGSIKLQVCNQLVYGVQPLIHEWVS